jgi:hypothetical protein
MPLIDLHSLAADLEFQSDLLIVGAGIAGLILDHRLRGMAARWFCWRLAVNMVGMERRKLSWQRMPLPGGSFHPLIFARQCFCIDAYHLMGGTRMVANPGQGVVDFQLRLHGLDNLVVASCSVFPTGGSSNPTLTLMQSTLRWAERIRTPFA